MNVIKAGQEGPIFSLCEADVSQWRCVRVRVSIVKNSLSGVKGPVRRDPFVVVRSRISQNTVAQYEHDAGVFVSYTGPVELRLNCEGWTDGEVEAFALIDPCGHSTIYTVLTKKVLGNARTQVDAPPGAQEFTWSGPGAVDLDGVLVQPGAVVGVGAGGIINAYQAIITFRISV